MATIEHHEGRLRSAATQPSTRVRRTRPDRRRRPRFSRSSFGPDAAAGAREAKQERYLYIATIAQSATDPDFVTVIGADPRRSDFGEIVSRIDMPNAGDELHHFGYSHDQRRLIVPGLFSNRIHILGIEGNGSTMTVDAVNDELAAKSGYVVPHTVIATRPDKAMVTMIGAATGDTKPGGIVEIDTRTGAFTSHFGPGPTRDANDLGPKYMYDFDALQDADLGISTTFGPPALCGGGIDPTCLGDEVAVWDTARQKVTQVASSARTTARSRCASSTSAASVAPS